MSRRMNRINQRGAKLPQRPQKQPPGPQVPSGPNVDVGVICERLFFQGLMQALKTDDHEVGVAAAAEAIAADPELAKAGTASPVATYLHALVQARAMAAAASVHLHVVTVVIPQIGGNVLGNRVSFAQQWDKLRAVVWGVASALAGVKLTPIDDFTDPEKPDPPRILEAP